MNATIKGRLTANATTRTMNDVTVVNFNVAINDSYRKLNAKEDTHTTTFVRCAYWLSASAAAHLLKGVMVELAGILQVKPYLSTDGQPKASLDMNVLEITIIGKED